MIIAKPMTPTLVFPAVVRLDFKSVYSPKKCIRQSYRGCLFRSKLADTFSLSPFLIGIGLVHLEMVAIVSPNLTGSSRFLWPLMPMPMPPPPLAVYAALELHTDYVELVKDFGQLAWERLQVIWGKAGGRAIFIIDRRIDKELRERTRILRRTLPFKNSSTLSPPLCKWPSLQKH
jgi:hypothetical protein